MMLKPQILMNLFKLQGKKINGEYVGVFVIIEIISVTEQTSDEGDIIYIQIDLKLQEFA